MRSSWVLVIAVVAGSLACGSGAPPAASPASWNAPALMAQIPADSPYVLASIEPVSAKVRDRVLAQLNFQLARFVELARHTSAEQILETTKPSDRAALAPWVRAGIAIAHELDAKDIANWPTQLGFGSGGRFALYGLSVWPVLRMEVANPVRLRQVIERALAAAGVPSNQRSLDGRAYWTAGTPEITLVASVLARDAVIAVVPTPALAGALPQLLGTQPPAQPLIATPMVPNLLARHRLSGFAFGYLDLQRIVEIVTGRGARELDAPIRALTGPVPPACGADLDRLAAVAPRMVFGYHRLDEAGFDGAVVFESPPSIAEALVRLRATAPEVTAAFGKVPLFAMGAAFNFDETIALLRRVTAEIKARPFGCAWLAELNGASASLADKLSHPFPPWARGLRGASLVIENGEILPPSIEGHLLIAGDHLADLIQLASTAMPALAGKPIKPDGVPVELSTQQLGIPFGAAIHVASSGDRLAIATGPASAQLAGAELTVATPRSSPLFTMALDGKRLQQLFASLGSGSDNLGALGQGKFSLDAGDAGLRFDVAGTWSEPPLSPASAPSAAAP